MTTISPDLTEPSEQDDSAEGSQTVVPDAKLPSVPASLPQDILNYAGSSRKSAVQVEMVKNLLGELQKQGEVILQQHHANTRAGEVFQSDPRFDGDRAALDEKQAKQDAYEAAAKKLAQEIQEARDAAIAQIVAEQNSSVDYETAALMYGMNLSSLQGVKKTFDATPVSESYKSFVSSLPTVANLSSGKRKGASSKAGNSAPGDSTGWKPSFATIKRNGTELQSKTLGQLANETSLPLAMLTTQLENSAGTRDLVDDRTYSFTITNNDKSDTFDLTYLSRKTARARAAQQDSDPNAGQHASEATLNQVLGNDNDDDAGLDF
jgi:hypothetical protein